jgi:hypothetical protein
VQLEHLPFDSRDQQTKSASQLQIPRRERSVEFSEWLDHNDR